MQFLLCDTKCIEAAHPDFHGGHNCYANALLSAKEHNLEHEVLTGDEVNARFPGYQIPSDYQVRPPPAFTLDTSLSDRQNAVSTLKCAENIGEAPSSCCKALIQLLCIHSSLGLIYSWQGLESFLAIFANLVVSEKDLEGIEAGQICTGCAWPRRHPSF